MEPWPGAARTSHRRAAPADGRAPGPDASPPGNLGRERLRSFPGVHVGRLAALLVLGALLATPGSAAAAPPIKHVWVLVLENKGYETTFGPRSEAPYLARDLPARGALVPNYYGIGHASLGNYIAMISGQAPNPQTQADCPRFNDFAPGALGPDGQALGQGCVYPSAVPTLAGQLNAKGLTWRGYMEDMGADRAREPATCGHPALNGADGTQAATPQDQYATRHDPFVYFHAIIDTPACQANVVPLDRLDGDLGSAARTPSFSFITPDLCSDAHDDACADGGPGGLKAANAFLERWVPRITGSPAYADGGLLVVTFDEADNSDAAACCGELAGPNSPLPGITGPGGGRTGAVVLSPYVRPGTVDATPYNHYALLRSIEDVFGLDHLGYAARAGLASFGPALYTSPDGRPPSALPLPGRRPALRCPRALPTGHGHRRFPRATLIAGASLRRSVLTVRLTHAARLTVRRSGRRGHRVLPDRRLSACRPHRFRLARTLRRVTLAAGAGGGVERRAVRAGR